MNITSMLNCGAAEQQRLAENNHIAQPISRNRTPWDAGGYSLPINTLSISSDGYHRIQTGPGIQALDDAEPQRTKSVTQSPGHRFSDSRSSLSSMASSDSIQDSNTHSRYSSMSTLNSAPTESLSMEQKRGPEVEVLQPIQDSSPRTPDDTRSPTGSLDTLAFAAEQQLSGQIDPALLPEGASIQVGRTGPRRPGSPSDALMIKRTNGIPLHLDTSFGGGSLSDGESFSAPATGDNHGSSTQIKTHKRAISAPGIPFARGQSFTPFSESTPSSQYPDVPSPPAMAPNGDLASAPAAGTGSDITAVKCLYIENCDTNSQPRKAISHIFGRNKMCTRLIPKEVWVHYCRKHYQRSKYRNPKEYAKLQCGLVREQINRVHQWSGENQAKGLPGVVQDWSLAVRKRERARLEDLSGAKNRKRRAGDYDGDEEADNADGGRGNTKPNAVPDWLLALLGKGYSTADVLGIHDRIHQDILDDHMPAFPDIEILPNIVVDQDEPKSPKGYAKRKSSSARPHQRSQSAAVPMKPGYYSPDRRMSQPNGMFEGIGGEYDPSPQKRRRPNEMNEMYPTDQFQRGRMPERHIQQQLPLRSYSQDWGVIPEQSMRFDYSRSPAPFQAPLQAPTPQRTYHVSELEVGSSRRPAHTRSHSDMSGMQYPLHGLQGGMQEFPPRPMAYDQYGYPIQQTQGYGSPVGNMRQIPNGHVRHQSASMIQGYPPQHTFYHDGRPPMHQLPSVSEAPPNMYGDRR